MIIKAKVIPNSSSSKVEICEDGTYKIWVKSAPIKGKANDEVVDIVAKHFNVGKKDVKIKNTTSRLKIIHINS